jgi:hypothetical protein
MKTMTELLAQNPLIAEKLGTRIPYADIQWLADQIRAHWEKPENADLECVDNGRLAVQGDTLTAEVYDDQCNHGCCGSCDTQFGPSPSGLTYLYGYNYGH